MTESEQQLFPLSNLRLGSLSRRISKARTDFSTNEGMRGRGMESKYVWGTQNSKVRESREGGVFFEKQHGFDGHESHFDFSPLVLFCEVSKKRMKGNK
ncbi:hypothetical protein TNCV_3581541 [Trichonephila clavipes]|nr:hypothetical protein TNCV_3581541 [Trichonephila clavipes]